MKLVLLVLLGLPIVFFLVGFFFFRSSIFGAIPSGEVASRVEGSSHYNKSEGIFLNRRPNLIKDMRKEVMTFSTIVDWLKGAPNRQPSKALPEVKPDLQEFLEPSEDIKVIWLGHSTFLLNLSGKIILVDPVFANTAAPVSFMVKRFQPTVLTLEELPKVDFILISHDHYDHLDMQSMKFFAKKDITFLMPLGVSAHLLRWGVNPKNILEFDWWDSKNLNGIEFVATPAQHFSGRSPFNENKTLWASWVIRSGKNNIYFSGDSGYDTHFKDIGDKYGPFDIAFIENGQYNKKWHPVHVLPEESVQAYFDLKAKRFFPIHWGMFVLSVHTWRDPVDNLLRLSKERGVNIVTPKIGQLVSVNDNYQNIEWWLDIE